MRWIVAERDIRAYIFGMRQFTLHVDARDMITFVDAQWLTFAIENDTPSLTIESVVGTSLWTHISDAATRQIYEILSRRVRRGGEPAMVPFRCDGPTVRRHMQMSILPRPENSLEYRSLLLAEERRGQLDLFSPDIQRGEHLVVMCSWCKRIRGLIWMEAEEAIREMGLFKSSPAPRLSHGICPQCTRQFLQADAGN
jgi:hypothetical protein